MMSQMSSMELNKSPKLLPNKEDVKRSLDRNTSHVSIYTMEHNQFMNRVSELYNSSQKTDADPLKAILRANAKKTNSIEGLEVEEMIEYDSRPIMNHNNTEIKLLDFELSMLF